MLDLKNNWKVAMYCFLRLSLWSVFYSAIILLPAFLILSPVFVGDNADKITEALKEGKNIFSQELHLLIIWALYIINFIIYKPALNKMFFKKYKKFEIVTAFQKLTWKFSILFYGKILVATYAVSALAAFITAFAYRVAGSPFQFALDSIISGPTYTKFLMEHTGYSFVIIFLSLLVNFLAVKTTIDNNTTISQKPYTTLILKQTIYSFARYFSWKYAFVFGILAVIFIIARFTSGNPVGFVVYFWTPLYLIASFFATKQALSKVLFKKYKYFKFIPHIQKVTWGLATKTWALTTVFSSILIYLGFWLILGAAIVVNDKMVSVSPIILAIVISLAALLLICSTIVRLCIERNADVVADNLKFGG